MIVWSKGLGKKVLPIELDKATVSVTPDHLAMAGTIESVCWEYKLRLHPDDLAEFTRLLANRTVVQFLARERGILLPFIARLALFIPKLTFAILAATTFGKLRRKD